MSRRNIKNKFFITGIIIVDIGIGTLILGGILSSPITLGIATGLIIFSAGCFVAGILREENVI